MAFSLIKKVDDCNGDIFHIDGNIPTAIKSQVLKISTDLHNSISRTKSFDDGSIEYTITKK